MSSQPLSSSRVGTLLAQHAAEVRQQWIETVAKGSRGRMSTAELEKELGVIFDALAVAVESGSTATDGAAYDDLRTMLTDFSAVRARQGFSPSETASAVFALKEVLLPMLSGAANGAYDDFVAFSRIVDDLGLITFEAYNATRENVIAGQVEQLLELSTPVVKLWEGVVGVPLVGTLDSARTQVVMENLLQTLVTTGSSHAIIDITGVPAVDTQVAQHLLKTVMAARLMGAECIISGIRPQIAQTIVALGIEFGDIVTKASLADALRITLRKAGFEVRRTTP